MFFLETTAQTASFSSWFPLKATRTGDQTNNKKYWHTFPWERCHAACRRQMIAPLNPSIPPHPIPPLPHPTPNHPPFDAWSLCCKPRILKSTNTSCRIDLHCPSYPTTHPHPAPPPHPLPPPQAALARLGASDFAAASAALRRLVALQAAPTTRASPRLPSGEFPFGGRARGGAGGSARLPWPEK